MFAINTNKISKLSVIKLEAMNDAKQWLSIKDLNDEAACFGLNRSPISVLSDHRFRD